MFQRSPVDCWFQVEPEFCRGSIGHRPGYDEAMKCALRGGSISVQAFIETLLPFQGAIAAANLPRASPWAMRLLGFQPAP